MGRKTVLLGFVGLYRTFKITSENMFANLITPNSHKYDFSIVINTDKKNKDRSFRPGFGWKSSDHYQYDDNKKLHADLIRYYDRKKQLKNIIYYNNNSTTIGGTGIYQLRIKQILEKEEKDYDFYMFFRMDIVLNKPINLNNFDSKCGFINSTNITCGLLHNRDFDYCWFGTKKGFLIFIFPEKTNTWDSIKDEILTDKLIYDINNNVGFRGKYIRNLKKHKNSWGIRWYRKIYNLQLNGYDFNVFHEKRNIYTRIIR